MRPRAVWAGVALVCLTACAKGPEAGSISPTIAPTVMPTATEATGSPARVDQTATTQRLLQATAPGPTTAALPPSASLVAVTALAVNSGLSFHPVPGTVTANGTASVAGTVTAATAIAAAEHEVRGDAVTKDGPIKVSLAYATDDVTAAGGKAYLPLSNRLVWVVEADGVLLDHGSGPIPGAADETELATVQWLIDAKTGQYVEARDFPSGTS
jgi:hypothetical protein